MIALGRRMSISISPPIYLRVPKEDVIVLGDGCTRRMEVVLRCISLDIGVMSREPPSAGHYLNVCLFLPHRPDSSTDITALVSRKCDYPHDVSNCTTGAKQPHYWLQAE